MSFNALILAGTRPDGDPFAAEQGVSHKSLIELSGKSLLQRVVEAVRQAGAARIAVSCTDAEVARLARDLGAEVLAARSGPSASVDAGLAELGFPLVVTTSDHAFLKGEWLTYFAGQTDERADVSIMLAHRTDVERAVPGARRTYLKFADGEWSGCNLFYLAKPDARKAVTVWQGIEADRKRPWRIVARLGLGTLLDYALGRLTLSAGIVRLGNRIGVEAQLVCAPDGLAAVDIDKAEDLELAREMIHRHAEG